MEIYTRHCTVPVSIVRLPYEQSHHFCELGQLDQLLTEGVKYMFVSNSDNLGATLDLDLLSYFAR